LSEEKKHASEEKKQFRDKKNKMPVAEHWSAAYRACAERTGLWREDRHRDFCALSTFFENVAFDETDVVVRVDAEGNVRFAPLDAHDVVRGQAQAFAALCELWDRGIPRLDVVSTGGTTRLADALRCTSAADVRRGLAIWSTLPCRIERVVVHEPGGAAWRVVKAVAWRLMPRKVRKKTTFVPRAS
jgi:hypothetical protein